MLWTETLGQLLKTRCEDLREQKLQSKNLKCCNMMTMLGLNTTWQINMFVFSTDKNNNLNVGGQKIRNT